ncbi:MAG TPA: 5'/3'-nucleotidase SurE [Gemmatimonadales bacterium]|nr:5'/3'-nucleotidase SurE [Gemmatimonadales bacterium]
MRILCTNDDGLHSPGLEELIAICSTIGQVSCVAPDREQSATSHSLTLHRPLRPIPRGPDRWQVDGTPTDCVVLALGALLKPTPDFVVAGINHGPNMGEDVLYSGTVAAAMEGLILGIPGVAVSFAGHDYDLIRTYRELLQQVLRRILSVERFPDDLLLNVNLPPVPASEVKGVRVTTLGKRIYAESLSRMKDPWGREIFWIGGGRLDWSGGDDVDFKAVEDRYVSVTPLHVDLTDYRQLEKVRAWRLGGGS